MGLMGSKSKYHDYHSSNSYKNSGYEKKDSNWCPYRKKKKINLRDNSSDTDLDKEYNTKNKILKKYGKSISTKYTIQEMIEVKKFSVYKVEHKINKKILILKIISKRKFCDALENEVLVLQKIKHENIVALVDVFTKKDKIIAFTMSCCSGGSLLNKMSENNLQEQYVLNIAVQILKALEYIHSIGITHRDLKPSHILFLNPNKNRVLLSDFTLSNVRSSHDDQPMQDICGTTDFLAPEVVQQRPYTQRVDVWALGVTVYMAVTGVHPFNNADRATLFREIAKADFRKHHQAFQSKSELFKDFISSVLVREDRPSATQCLTHPWIEDRLTDASLSSSDDSAQSSLMSYSFHWAEDIY